MIDVGKYCWCEDCFLACPHLDTDRRKQLINDSTILMKHLHDYGFIAVANSAIHTSIVQNVFQNSKMFFQQPQSIKLESSSKDKARRGYCPNQTENFAALIGLSGKPNDRVEKIRFGPEIDFLTTESTVTKFIIDVNQCQDFKLNSPERRQHDHGYEYYHSKESKSYFYPNTWPKYIPDFKSSTILYYQSMERISEIVFRMIQYHLNLHCNFFAEKVNKHTSILGYNYYASLNPSEINDHEAKESVKQSPNEPSSYEIIRVFEHTDVSVFTIITQWSDVIGCGSVQEPPDNKQSEDYLVDHTYLELWDAINQRWIRPVNSQEDLGKIFIIHSGDCLQYWSGGYFPSVKHRVITRYSDPNHLGNNRYSAAYFCSPNYDAELNWPQYLNCVDTVGKEQKQKYSTWRKSKIKEAMKVIR